MAKIHTERFTGWRGVCFGLGFLALIVAIVLLLAHVDGPVVTALAIGGVVLGAIGNPLLRGDKPKN